MKRAAECFCSLWDNSFDEQLRNLISDNIAHKVSFLTLNQFTYFAQKKVDADASMLENDFYSCHFHFFQGTDMRWVLFNHIVNFSHFLFISLIFFTTIVILKCEHEVRQHFHFVLTAPGGRLLASNWTCLSIKNSTSGTEASWW